MMNDLAQRFGENPIVGPRDWDQIFRGLASAGTTSIDASFTGLTSEA
jgi:hypothetical protein